MEHVKKQKKQKNKHMLNYHVPYFREEALRIYAMFIYKHI